MGSLGLSFTRSTSRTTSLSTDQAILLARTQALPWPAHAVRHLPAVLRKSWEAYDKFWDKVVAAGASMSSGADARLLTRMMSTGFLSTPYWFVKQWLDSVHDELRWRRARFERWGVWSVKNRLFIRLGQDAAEAYCGDGARFDQLLKVVMR